MAIFSCPAAANDHSTVVYTAWDACIPTDTSANPPPPPEQACSLPRPPPGAAVPSEQPPDHCKLHARARGQVRFFVAIQQALQSTAPRRHQVNALPLQRASLECACARPRALAHGARKRSAAPSGSGPGGSRPGRSRGLGEFGRSSRVQEQGSARPCVYRRAGPRRSNLAC